MQGVGSNKCSIGVRGSRHARPPESSTTEGDDSTTTEGDARARRTEARPEPKKPTRPFEQVFEPEGESGYRSDMTTSGPPAGRTRGNSNASSKVSELPDGPPDATGLTPRQQRILNVIRDNLEQRGYPPSMREIGELVGLTSSSSVSHQLRVLEEKGFLKRDPNRPRAIEVFLPEVMAARRSISAGDDHGFDPTGIGDALPTATYVPVVGRIAAGGPILAEERVEDVFPLPKQLVGDGTLFLLEVSGDSMIDAAICNGDYVVIRQQPIGRQRRDRGRDDRRRSHGEDVPEEGRPDLAAPAQRRLRPDRRHPRHDPRQGHRGPAPGLSRDRRTLQPAGSPPHCARPARASQLETRVSAIAFPTADLTRIGDSGTGLYFAKPFVSHLRLLSQREHSVEVVELRVHGVHGTSPGAMLGVSDSEAGQVAGDKLTGIYRIKDGKPPYRRFGWAPISVEAYSWGALTSGVQGVLGWVKRALWLLLLPFALANLAYWARLEIGTANGKDVWGARAVRLCALLLTVFMVLSPCVVVIDMVGWQCYRYGVPGCTQVPGQLDFLADLTAPQRLAVTSLVPMLLVGLLWVLSRQTLIRYEETPAPKAAPLPSGTIPADPGRRPILCDPDLWSSKARTLRLQRLHLGAAVATVCAFSGLHVVNTDGGGSAFLAGRRPSPRASCSGPRPRLTALSHPRDLESPPPGRAARSEVNALREHAGWFTVLCVAVYLLHRECALVGRWQSRRVGGLPRAQHLVHHGVRAARGAHPRRLRGRQDAQRSTAVTVVLMLLAGAVTAGVLYGKRPVRRMDARGRGHRLGPLRGSPRLLALPGARPGVACLARSLGGGHARGGLLGGSAVHVGRRDRLGGLPQRSRPLGRRPGVEDPGQQRAVRARVRRQRQGHDPERQHRPRRARPRAARRVTVHSGTVTVDGLSLRVTDGEDEAQGYAVGRGTTTIEDRRR